MCNIFLATLFGEIFQTRSFNFLKLNKLLKVMPNYECFKMHKILKRISYAVDVAV